MSPFRPMTQFDPARPALVHDRLHAKTFEWLPEGRPRGPWSSGVSRTGAPSRKVEACVADRLDQKTLLSRCGDGFVRRRDCRGLVTCQRATATLAPTSKAGKAIVPTIAATPCRPFTGPTSRSTTTDASIRLARTRSDRSCPS
jgi:hypothetical protein